MRPKWRSAIRISFTPLLSMPSQTLSKAPAEVSDDGWVVVKDVGKAEITASCGSVTSNPIETRPYRVVYFNSFESPEDTVGWVSYGTLRFNSDTPPDGGNRSLYVAGGCFFPTAAFELDARPEDRHLIVSVWGKSLELTGGVGLETRSPYEEVAAYVSDTTWHFYKSGDTLFCPANQPLYVTATCGGIIYRAMLIDRLEVRQVKLTAPGGSGDPPPPGAPPASGGM
jgi:hypothetical protein